MIIIVSLKNRSLRGENYTLTALWLLCAFLLFYFLKSPTLAANSVRSALDVCAAGLIPSLFPFIVLVSVFNSSGLSARIAHVIGRPLGWLFGIDRLAASAILLGTLGGFPIGAVCTRELYATGVLTKSDAQRLITFTNNASPAFCIGTVGLSLFGDIAFGVRLYFCQIFAALLIGVVQRKKPCKHATIQHDIARISVSDSVSAAISNGALSIIKICGFAVFFAVVGDALSAALSHYFGEVCATLGTALCELTLAARGCAALDSNIARPLCALAVGWSGISVHMQVTSILSGSGIKVSRYYICKLVQGILSALLMQAIYCF